MKQRSGVVQACQAVVVAEEGLLLGGVKRHASAPFEESRHAVRWADVVIQANKEAGRRPLWDGPYLVTVPAGRVVWAEDVEAKGVDQ